MMEPTDDPRYTGRDTTQPTEATDPFDRQYWQLHDLPDVLRSTETTQTVIDGIAATTYIVQTMRQRERGDFIFVQRTDKRGTVRIVFPPKVADAIARQRDTLTTRSRQKVARDVAAERKRLGVLSGFAAMTAEQRAAAQRKARAAREKTMKDRLAKATRRRR